MILSALYEPRGESGPKTSVPSVIVLKILINNQIA